MVGHIEVSDLAGSYLHDHKDIEHSNLTVSTTKKSQANIA
jgi:hypothetical protein